MRTHDEAVADIARYFETMTPAALARLDEIYTADARFKDPFNEVQGLPAIRGVFAHMYSSLDAPRFVVHERIVQGEQVFLSWDFIFSLRGRAGGPLTVRGGSHLKLAADGRISVHRDYWDVAEELYEKLPVLGSLMRWLKRRVNS